MSELSEPCFAVCHGCEEQCCMPIELVSANSGEMVAFVVCDKRSDTNRVYVQLEECFV